MDNKNKTDKGLLGNEKIEEAVAALQQETTQEMLAHTLTVIRRRMREAGQLIVVVEPSVGDNNFNIQSVKTDDGKCWWMAFTSFDEELKGSNIYLDFASVGATINIMLAAVKAEGTTIIDNAAREPEIVNIAMFLNSMGAKITGAGTSTIRIKGVKNMHSSVHEVIPDRIEAGTYIMIGACACKRLVVENIIPEHLEALTQKLIEMGVDLKIEDDSIYISNKNKLKAVKIKTQVYPGFPTDMQQVMSALMTKAEGKSVIEETIFENRFQNLYELRKMGANIEVSGNKGYIFGPTKLRGKTVNATDLRAGASLVLAALIAEGTTTINNADYILRGYEHITEKLTSLGAKIELTQI